MLYGVLLCINEVVYKKYVVYRPGLPQQANVFQIQCPRTRDIGILCLIFYLVIYIKQKHGVHSPYFSCLKKKIFFSSFILESSIKGQKFYNFLKYQVLAQRWSLRVQLVAFGLQSESGSKSYFEYTNSTFRIHTTHMIDNMDYNLTYNTFKNR